VVDATLVTGTLAIRVTDDGAGLTETHGTKRPGSGTALANIRERLLRRFGQAGTLTLESVTPHGVRATLRLPIS
jgi:LytS/YehU family sensor histidine kinase